ncbi:tyrosine tRNA ligase [Ramicandelaber brevisporus]|nr:tyrosine tRNA ligase [Ramicandelaber brevisporus]
MAATAAQLSVDEKFTLITRGLQEVLGEDELRAILAERPLKLYWGTAPTGKPHLGYFAALPKLADFLAAGCEVKVLLADIHAFLDNMKAPEQLVKKRTEYYEKLIKAALQKSLGVPVDKLCFVVGSSYQLKADYAMDNFRLCAMVTEHDAKKAGSQVVKQVAEPVMSGLLYPGMQALDEEYLKVDAQFGGVDQRKIFALARAYLPRLGYAKRIHLMNFMVPGLQGDKMSSSDADSKIDLLDAPKDVAKKIRAAFCEEGNVENNGVLSFVKFVLLPLCTQHARLGDQGIVHAPHIPRAFTVKRRPENGGDISYTDFAALERDFAERRVHPGDLKNAVADAINILLAPLRAEFEDAESQALIEAAYPTGKAAAKPKEKSKKEHLTPEQIAQRRAEAASRKKTEPSSPEASPQASPEPQAADVAAKLESATI